jgi:prolyl-tRNA synthetase
MLSNSGVEVLLDDSDDLPETRFAYADLLGIPMKIIATGELQTSVEIRQRKSAESQWVHSHRLVPLLQRHPG